ncbi:hypothetical protein BC629DRAFT_796568 [Irpex lacteus]|nr:hypothetical protein BC629DRAFT_796568 [Irpex lacteus]
MTITTLDVSIPHDRIRESCVSFVHDQHLSSALSSVRSALLVDKPDSVTVELASQSQPAGLNTHLHMHVSSTVMVLLTPESKRVPTPLNNCQISTQVHHLLKLYTYPIQPFSISSGASTTNPSQSVSFSAAAAGPHQRSAVQDITSPPTSSYNLHPHRYLYVTLIWIPRGSAGLTDRLPAYKSGNAITHSHIPSSVSRSLFTQITAFPLVVGKLEMFKHFNRDVSVPRPDLCKYPAQVSLETLCLKTNQTPLLLSNSL